MDCCHDKWTSANSVFRFRTRCELCGTKMLGVWNAAQCLDCGWYMHDSCAAALKQTLARFKTTESNTDAVVPLRDEKTVTSDHEIDVIAGELTCGLENGVSVHASIAVGLHETTAIGLQTTGHDLAEYAERETFRRAEGISVSNEKTACKSGAKPAITAAAGSGQSCLKTPNTAAFEQVHDGHHKLNRTTCHRPKLWNPVRVGPPLLIPINGGPILITLPDDGQSDFDPIYYGLDISKPVRKDPPPIWNPVRVGPPLLIPINGGPIWITSVE